MTQKHSLTLMLLGGAMAGMLLWLTATRFSPLAHAAPAATVKAGPLMDLFTGKAYPLTLKAEQIDATYRLVALVDSQGKPSLYATRGETTATGGETYLICYEVQLTDPKTNPIPQPKPGTTAQIIYINLHAIQAMGGIIPIQPATLEPAPIAPPSPTMGELN